jgi:uncharacterized protein with ParB-like and HNH nuclease domain
VIAEATPLLDIFVGSKQFEVPIYQRTYAWKEQDRQQLWNDLLRAGRNPKANAHFVGSVVYIQSAGTFGSSVSKARLIDGQQRLTTIMLLLAALIERLRADGDLVLELVDEEGEVHEETITADWLQQTYLLNSTVTGELRFKLLLTKGDRATLMHHLGHVPLPDDPSEGVQAAMAYFQKQLQSAKLADVFLGLRKLQVVNVQLEQGKDDPQLIFESLNSTGKDLTQADLIRNYVLMGLAGPKQKEVYEHSWFPMEELFRHAGEDAFDRFVRDYLTLKTRVIPNITKVYAEFKLYRQDDEVAAALSTDELVQDMAEHARLYIRLVQPSRLKDKEQDELMQALLDLDAVEVRVSYPFLLQALWDHKLGKLTLAELVKLVRLTEAFVVRRAVCELKTNPLNRIFSQLSKDIDKADYAASAGRALLRLRDQQRFPSDEEFRAELVRRPLYNSRDLCKAMLVRLERDFSPKELSVTDNLTIEHVLPQNEDLSAPWRTMLGGDNVWKDVQAALKHTLGNLTLTGYNSELGDLPFEKKKTLESPKGYESSKMLMTQNISKQAQWNEAAILARAAELSGRALRLWAQPDLPADEILALRQEARKKAFNDAWERLQTLPSPMIEAVLILDERMGQLGGINRRIATKDVAYRKGNRYFLYLSTDDTELHLSALLGEAPHDIHPSWSVGKNKGWWQVSVTTVEGLDGIWADLMGAWAKLPDVAIDAANPQNIQAAIQVLTGDAQVAFETFEQALIQISSMLERKVNQFYIGYGLPVEVTGLMRSGYIQIEIRPPDPDLISAALFADWEDRSKERRALNLLTPADVERALPLIRTVHQQFVQEIPYRQPHVRGFMRGLRLAFKELEPTIKTKATKTAERFLIGEKDIARVYITADDVVLLLRHPFATLENPQGLGTQKEGEPFADWPAGHFEGTFGTTVDMNALRSLLEQTLMANRA